MKEVLALAAYGVDLHLREVRRLGLSEQGVTEAIAGAWKASSPGQGSWLNVTGRRASGQG